MGYIFPGSELQYPSGPSKSKVRTDFGSRGWEEGKPPLLETFVAPVGAEQRKLQSGVEPCSELEFAPAGLGRITKVNPVPF